MWKTIVDKMDPTQHISSNYIWRTNMGKIGYEAQKT